MTKVTTTEAKILELLSKLTREEVEEVKEKIASYTPETERAKLVSKLKEKLLSSTNEMHKHYFTLGLRAMYDELDVAKSRYEIVEPTKAGNHERNPRQISCTTCDYDLSGDRTCFECDAHDNWKPKTKQI